MKNHWKRIQKEKPDIRKAIVRVNYIRLGGDVFKAIVGTKDKNKKTMWDLLNE